MTKLHVDLIERREDQNYRANSKVEARAEIIAEKKIEKFQSINTISCGCKNNLFYVSVNRRIDYNVETRIF